MALLFYINDTRHEIRAGTGSDDLVGSLNDYIRLKTRFKVCVCLLAG